ncbi:MULTISPECIES: arsenate reductase (glutaredoxin) [Sphingobacterium]|uniref:Arsenate reductase (Glutaredoxin) n=1 Tax=Sphingobacterium hotanense TaxID=649196 RepID=A0ABT7NSA4_9SPHI|nr:MULTISPECIES: arsenate reductase (glutaredoxin) [Sphingobacterium]MDM1050115.1 arsenate reductase (glutaredoxin) [Sphingobacterium hotanense]
MIKIYHNQMCSKSRAALTLLEERGEEFVVKEYLNQVPLKEELEGIVKMLGIRPIDLIRKNEEVFKQNYADMELDDEQWIDIMIQNPILMERPIVVRDGIATIGRLIEKVMELLK